MTKKITKKIITSLLIISMFVALFVIYSASQTHDGPRLSDFSSPDSPEWKFIDNTNIVADAFSGAQSTGDAVYGTSDTSYWEANYGGDWFLSSDHDGTIDCNFSQAVLQQIAAAGYVQIQIQFNSANEGPNGPNEWRARYSDGVQIVGLSTTGTGTFTSAWTTMATGKAYAKIVLYWRIDSNRVNKGEIKDCIVRVLVNDSTNPSVSLTGTTAYSGRNFATSSSAGFTISDAHSGVKYADRQKATFDAPTTWTDVDNEYSNTTSRVTSTTLAIDSGFGDYRVVATDQDLHTGTSSTIRYWIPTLKVTSTATSAGTTTASITGGTQYIGTASTSTSTSLTRYPSQVFYLRAAPASGYLFNGFDIEYSGLNSGMTTEIGYSSFTYSGGWFYYAITLSDNLCVLGNTYTSVAFRAKFAASVVTTGYLAPYNTTYNGLAQAYPSLDSNYLSIGSIGSDREAVV
ncbi:MAG: hypothetical protein GXY10_04175, partial [Clostridiales bacterium]|nr:hypothetical protein [Clostridiales bacterium]